MDVEGFLNRFNRFYDSVVRSLQVTFQSSSCVVTIEISTRDLENTRDDGWCNVILVVDEVTSFQFTENPKASYQVISDGLNMLARDESVFIDFANFTELPVEPGEFFHSPSHVVGRHLHWKVAPYSESS